MTREEAALKRTVATLQQQLADANEFRRDIQMKEATARIEAINSESAERERRVQAERVEAQTAAYDSTRRGEWQRWAVEHAIKDGMVADQIFDLTRVANEVAAGMATAQAWPPDVKDPIDFAYCWSSASAPLGTEFADPPQTEFGKRAAELLRKSKG